METLTGSNWKAMPSELDGLCYPLVQFAGGAAEGELALLIEGRPQPGSPDLAAAHFVLTFRCVEAVLGFGEALYSISVGADEAPVGTAIQVADQSEILAEASQLRSGPLRHFRLLSGGMQCEIVASPDFTLRRAPSREEALAEALATRCLTENYDRSDPRAQVLLDSLMSGSHG